MVHRQLKVYLKFCRMQKKKKIMLHCDLVVKKFKSSHTRKKFQQKSCIYKNCNEKKEKKRKRMGARETKSKLSLEVLKFFACNLYTLVNHS